MRIDDDTHILTRDTKANAADRVVLLDGFELHCRGELVELPVTAQRLLGYLALQDRTVARSQAAATLWLDSTDKHAAASLRSALWRLRRPGYPLVETTQNHLRLARWVRVDYRDLRSAAQELIEGDAGRVTTIDPVRLSGELLPHWLDDWVLLERERFRHLRLHALEALCGRLTRLGRYSDAIEAGLAAVACEPLRESAHRLLIEAHLAEGNGTEAVRQYRWYCALLHDELGVRPPLAMERRIRLALPGLVGPDGTNGRH
jgi:DNA-binding SARP family transcriptional activator